MVTPDGRIAGSMLEVVVSPGSETRYVVHEHDAIVAGLHHDLRIEVAGVLKSWAVPKLMPVEAGVQRLAVAVEDHAIEYGKFEGTLSGGYGAGDVRIWEAGAVKVLVWDERKIELEFNGEKLNGKYVMVAMKKPKNWLIWKKKGS